MKPGGSSGWIMSKIHPQQALFCRRAADDETQPEVTLEPIRRLRRGGNDVLKQRLLGRPFKLSHHSKQLMIDTKTEVGLSWAIVQQESWDPRCSFDAEAQCGEVEGQNLQRVNCCRSSISSKIYRKLNASAGEYDTTFGVLTEQASNN